MFENVKKAFFKGSMRKPLAILLSLAMVMTMFPMTVMAAAAETVTVQVTDSSGETKTLAVWTYDSASETYIDNATGKELSFVKDFTAADNLKGSVNGQDYDFTDLGALVYTGCNKKPDCRALAVTTKGMLLEDVYDYAGELLDASKGVDVLKSDDTKMVLAASDSAHTNSYTYNDYWGQTKYYYPTWYANDTAKGSEGIVSEEDQKDGRVVPTTLTIKGYHATTGATVADLIASSDASNSLRSAIGQQQGGAIKTSDANLGFNSVKNISFVKFTLDKTFAEEGIGAGTDQPGTDDYDWNSDVWAGGLDFSWYDENDVKSEYHITTPAQWEALAWICSEDLDKLADYKTNTNDNIKALKGTIPTKQNTFAGVQFYLDNDIDMDGVKAADGTWSGPNYYPVGSQAANDLNTNCFYGLFFGSFDGQGHIVKNVYCMRNNSSVGGKGSESVGLFGRLGAADNTDYPAVDITIENIAASGYIEGYRSTGGVVGKTLHVATGNTVTVKNCMNFVDVVTKNGSKGTGGVIGTAWNGAVVENCANFGNVTGGYRSANVAGVNGASESALSNSYNVGTVSNTVNAANVGAVALNQMTVDVTNCYALEGSAPGYPSSIVNGNTLVSGGWKTEAEMKAADFAKLLSGSNAGAWVQIGTDYKAVSSDVAALVGEYPVPAAFAMKDPGDISWYNTTDKEFTLNTAAQLKGLASIVNGEAGIAKDDFAGKTVKLGADIAVDTDGKYTSAEGTFGSGKYIMTANYYQIDASKSPVIWTPIGSGTATSNTNASGNVFAGTFDGCGYTVSGIYTGATEITETTGNTATVQGLFGIVSGTVKNVTVSGCITGKIVVGGIAAHLDGGTVENCVNNAIVYADGGQAPNSGLENGVSRAGAVGGIAGYAKDGSTVKSCVNNADVTCTNTAKGGRCGGIIGLVESSDTVAIENDANTGNINAYQYAGGIIGMNASKTSPINACYNTGNITGNTGGSCYIGGIVATCNSDITNCYNYGNYKVIYSGKAAHDGGIVSDFFGTKIENCYNTGMCLITGSSYGAICGTGYGNADANKLINCYTLEGTVGEDIDNGCVTVKTADEMKSADFVKLLNGEGNAWAKGTEYPVLRWQRTLESISVELPGTVFTEGQIIGKDDITVTASYSNGVTETVTDFDYDKKEALTEADTQITVTYTEDGVEKTATAAISVIKASDLAWYDPEKTELTINTAGELRAFAAIVNGDMPTALSDAFEGRTVKLGADIDVSGKEWNPIGYADNAFAGIFDGQSHTVSGLTITTGEGGYKGLFGNNAGTLKNFTVSGSIGTAENMITSGSDNIGGAAGFNNGTVSGVTGKVAIHINTTGIYAVGGIVGQNGENGTVTECSNEADIVATKAVGGIVGRNYGAVSKCVNTGNISGNTGGNHGKDGIGGIVGLGGDKNATYTNTVTSCYNRGNITNDQSKWVGGIVGMTDGATTVSNCYNTGTVSGYGQYNPIIGQNEGTALYNYCLDTTITNDADGVYGGTKEGNEAKTADEMKAADFVTLLNSKAADTWKAGNSKTNDGYPVLSWQPLNSTGGGSGSGGSGGGGGAATTVQKPTITAGEGGKTSLSSDGTTLTITPDTGYEISKVTLNGVDKGAVGSLTGLKTGDKVTVEFIKKAETPASSSFNDVKDSDWFSDSVKYVAENGLMTGTGVGTFSPNASTTRGMLMTILARKSGVDTAGSTPWYQAGLDWAVKNGISDGTNPNKAITREQLASMLYRYAGSPQTSGDISKFSDAGSVSAYAQNAMKWAVEKGIVTGKGNNTLAPASNATRAEMAAMLQRYCSL